MPRCYKVTVEREEDGKVLAIRYAGTQASARTLKGELAEEFGVDERKCTTFEEAEIPASKDELIMFVNGLCKKMDCADQAAEPVVAEEPCHYNNTTAKRKRRG